jgi:D-inositol-3-phosphate glycosyltransferase
MTPPESYPPIVILDPGNFTPLYDLNLASSLARRGWHPRLVTSSHQFDDPPVLPGIAVSQAFYRFLRLPWMRFLRHMPKLRRFVKVAAYPVGLARLFGILKGTGAGILHVQWALAPPLDRILWGRLQARGWRVVFTAHEPSPLAGTLPDWLTRSRGRLWRAADAVIVHGPDAARTMREGGVEEERIHVLPPGAPAIPAKVTRAEARLALGIAPDRRVILFFGYIKPYKGLHVLLQSVALIKNQVEQVLCLVAGECVEDPARYRRLIAELQLGSEVRLNTGYVPERLGPLYFAACDVVALPYLEAAYSGVLLSAYAFARPVVATAVGGNAELVEDGETGILVRRGDPVALAAALGKILQDPDKAGRMGACGSERLAERYPWDKIAGLTERVYGSFAEEPPHDFSVNN